MIPYIPKYEQKSWRVLSSDEYLVGPLMLMNIETYRDLYSLIFISSPDFVTINLFLQGISIDT